MNSYQINKNQKGVAIIIYTINDIKVITKGNLKLNQP